MTIPEAQLEIIKEDPKEKDWAEALMTIKDAITNDYRLCKTEEAIVRIQAELDDVRLNSDLRYSDYSFLHDFIAKAITEAME